MTETSRGLSFDKNNLIPSKEAIDARRGIVIFVNQEDFKGFKFLIELSVVLAAYKGTVS